MTLTAAQHRLQQPEPNAAFHRWTLPGGSTWTEFYRRPGGYMLRFPDLADFEISNDAQIAMAHPVPGVAQSTMEHLYLNQVLPLLLSTQGQLVFHASAFALEACAVAFAAHSGRGKSTLAASFAMAGHSLLTDDGLLLEPTASGYNVRPSHPSIRLWDDSSEALIPADAATSPAISYSSKSRFLAGDHVRFSSEPQPLRCVFFLGEGAVSEITIEPMAPAQALIEWVKHSFLLDIEDQPRLATHFDDVARLAAHPFHYRLDYPRHYCLLPEVQAAIVSHLGSLSGA
ncbi:hypothetical protein [Synechococcus sp. CCY 0621]|uniref:hypothetical protein n=1 Tax=Synechococcus sp. CCY 0621 TaxID=2815603 RepID=UPI001C239B69|nr:hypothetical protein [Synechococcus sp. CCY 0621]